MTVLLKCQAVSATHMECHLWICFVGCPVMSCLEHLCDSIDGAVCWRCGRLFRDGNINWGRIVTLLCFGYRMAVTVIQRGIRGFFTEIVGFVVRFVLSERIARWIADQGGWVSGSHCNGTLLGC